MSSNKLKPKGFPCLVNTRKALHKSFNVAHRLRMRELRGCLQPTRNTYPVCRSLFGKIPGRLGIPLKAILDDRFLTEEGHVFLGFSKDGNFVLSYTLKVDTDEHTAFPVYIYQLHWWRFNHYKPMEKVSEVGLFGGEEIQQDLYIAVCTWPSDDSKVMVYGCSTSSKPLSDEEKLLCYVTITAVPSIVPCPNCLHLKYTSDMSTGISAAFQPSWLPAELQEDMPTAAAPMCLLHGFAVHTKYELAPPFPPFSPKHSLSKDGVAVLNTGYSIIAIAVNLGKGSPCSSLYSPGNSSVRSYATRVSDVSSLRGGGNRCRDWLHASSSSSATFIGSQGHSQHEDRGSVERRHDLSSLPVPLYSQSSTAITDFCNYGFDDGESSDSEDLLLGIRLASGLQAPQSASPSVISSRDFLDILDEEESEGADLCQLAKKSNIPPSQVSKGQSSPLQDKNLSTRTLTAISEDSNIESDLDSTMCVEPDSTDSSLNHTDSKQLPKMYTPNRDLPSISPCTNDSQASGTFRNESQGGSPFRDISQSKAPDSCAFRISQHPTRNILASPDHEFTSPSDKPSSSSDHRQSLDKPLPDKPLSDSLVSSSDYRPSADKTLLADKTLHSVDLRPPLHPWVGQSTSEISVTLTSSSLATPKMGNPNPTQGSPRHLQHGIDLDARYHGLSPRSFESEEFSPPTSNCPTPSRWGQTSTFRHSRPTFDNWSTCSSVSFHRLNDSTADRDDIGSEIDHTCPYHHGYYDDFSQGSCRSTIRECTCKLQRFTYSVRRYVERLYAVDHEPIETDGFDYHSMLPLSVVGASNMRMIPANRSLPQEGPFVEVKQLTMDAEHYMCEAIRTVAPWGRRYIAFTDYDMQVLDVCADSCSVIVMIKCLVRAWPEPNKPKDVFEFEDESAYDTPQMFQTGFKFAWNLKTGQYKTFEVEGLQEFDQAQLCKVWNPGRALCQRIQRRWAIPQAHTKGVHVLTNEAVFKNRSLTKLLDPLHYVAIVLH